MCASCSRPLEREKRFFSWRIFFVLVATSGTLVNPSSVGVFCWGGLGMPFEWLATTCLSIKVQIHHCSDTAQIGQNGGAAGGVPSSQLIECDPASANLSGQIQTVTNDFQKLCCSLTGRDKQC